jgi:hypothetical protein
VLRVPSLDKRHVDCRISGKEKAELGVVDRLLEEPWFRIEAISGDGAAGARAALDSYWRLVAASDGD